MKRLLERFPAWPYHVVDLLIGALIGFILMAPNCKQSESGLLIPFILMVSLFYAHGTHLIRVLVMDLLKRKAGDEDD